MSIDVEQIRRDFPILQETVYGRPLIYLDNAATTQLPTAVLDGLQNHYRHDNANPHRGIYALGAKATAHRELARAEIGAFINARNPCEIVLCSGTTDAINLVAASFGDAFLKPGDEIIVSAMEHHSNWVPWQMLCRRQGARLKVIPLEDNGELRLDRFTELLSEKTRLVAVTQVSNVLGTVNPLDTIIKLAHQRDIPVLVDGAQSIRHEIIDVQQLDCDFFCFSGHKVLAPAGIGVLYAKENLLRQLQPTRFGGGMMAKVDLQQAVAEDLPHTFEAGTPNCAGAVALAAALRYLNSLGRDAVQRAEQDLTDYCCARLSAIADLHILGQPQRRAGVISFNVDNLHPYDIAMLLDKLGIAVRSGQHCAQPLFGELGLSGAVRVSPAFYNSRAEIDSLVDSVTRVIDVLRRQESKP